MKWIIGLGALLVAAALGQARGQNPSDAVYRPRTVLRKPMPAIIDPPIIAGSIAKLADSELVIGVTIGGQARAYPINQLTGPRREIVNDQLAGIAIAATW